MPSRLFPPSAALGCLLLAACSSHPLQESATYSQGYEAACAAIGDGMAGKDPASASVAARDDGNREFGAGWDSGLHCRDSVAFTD